MRVQRRCELRRGRTGDSHTQAGAYREPHTRANRDCPAVSSAYLAFASFAD